MLARLDEKLETLAQGRTGAKQVNGSFTDVIDQSQKVIEAWSTSKSDRFGSEQCARLERVVYEACTSRTIYN